MDSTITDAIAQAVKGAEGTAFGIWFLIAAAMVFFMQTGFAMVETGFTRAKNAGNIIMKNLMDFCIGTIAFVLIGAALLFSSGESWHGFIGIPNWALFTNFAGYDWANFVFNLVFCATAATIVSGAMAERTKFISYLIYSAVISAIVYPIEAHWVWGGGWLQEKGYIDFAGSSAIHMVGGVAAFIGAWFLGARIGKYSTDKDGATRVHAIPGHSLTLGALGVFILWFGWYGFNGAAATEGLQMAQIFGTTTLATAAATVVAMFLTWSKNGKPDVSMTLNGSLAGLVAVTAGCANVDGLGALIIGAVAGFIVVFAIEFIDQVIKVDDPVGAISVHGVCGIWGTLAVGLFNINADPETGIGLGLFYGGGTSLLGLQVTGVVAILLWTIVTMVIVFGGIKLLFGLRVSREEELVGLDLSEHGLNASYADFAQVMHAAPAEDPVDFVLESGDRAPSTQTVQGLQVVTPAVATVATADTGIWKVVIVTRQNRFDRLKDELGKVGITGMTVVNVMGCGIQKGAVEKYRGVPVEINLLPKVKVEIVVSKVPVRNVIDAAKSALYTGNIGDGKIFVYRVDNVVKVRTGEEGVSALQYVADI